ncbi:DUF5677 domain-containing protein [Micromonospora sp. NPDC049836]|uniref:DUF5677 domain-containing protein n=1 Tax=Micromonospora sp. NPDC049836 TaxID=3364274 RepID=UPI00378AB8BC
MKRQQRTETSGPLSGHVRKGRRYLSPLAATGVLHIGDWVRDDLPDLLWPVLALAELGSTGAIRFVRWQGAVQRDLAGRAEPKVLADGLDGRLTSLDRLIEQVPDARSVVRDRAVEHGLLPQSVAAALASYPERPAGWLVDLDIAPPGQSEVDLLTRAVLEALRDGHREAIIKCLSIWSAVQAGTFRSGSATIELLKPYPNDSATRSQADSAIRAMWGAMKGLCLTEDATRFDATTRWAKVFWGFNSMTTRCIRSRDESDQSGTQEGGRNAAPGATPEDAAHLRQLAMDLLSSYVEALETSPARLYDQERQEVHSGLVSRAGREVITALGVPDLWCMEHGAHVGRVLVEVRIYLQWMALQDPSIYRAYQEYGSGKAKLYRRIADEFPQYLLRRPDVKEAIEEFDRLSHNDGVLDHRIVDTSDSFAGGKSLRAMAEESGLRDLYRHAYYMFSGVQHSEWWSVETHCMERCLNILHRGHLIPSLSLSAGGNVDLAGSWVDSLHALIRVSLDILGTEKEAVTAAFSWLASEEGSDDASALADGVESTEPA